MANTEERGKFYGWTYGDFMMFERDVGLPREWGVQVVINDKTGRIFVRKDSEEGKIEGHMDELWRFSVSSQTSGRLNGVSGGFGRWEDPASAADRELRQELDGRYSGEGRLQIYNNVPIWACYQERGGKIYLLGGMLVTYEATDAEVARLSECGLFADRDALIEYMKTRESNAASRPAFRTAILVLAYTDHDKAAEFIDAWNHAIVEAASYQANQRGLKVEYGVFEAYRFSYE